MDYRFMGNLAVDNIAQSTPGQPCAWLDKSQRVRSTDR
jgi:hypothetical protein